MNIFQNQDNGFLNRHIGTLDDKDRMLGTIGEPDMESLIAHTIPDSIRIPAFEGLPQAVSEQQYLSEIRTISEKNKLYKTYIGQGYYPTITPPAILRNVFENPGWYTAYTPYQAEISQGRLESLLNFQTMVCDLTGLELSNASLLDEATAAAEAMSMLFHHQKEGGKKRFFVDKYLFPQTIDVLFTRAEPIGIEIVVGDHKDSLIDHTYFGAIVQYPNDNGHIDDYRSFINKAHENGCYVAMATDLLALTLLVPPGELGADVAIGSAQRFGVPLGYGGPHAAFFATREEFKRGIPGRLIGVSKDAQNGYALRMALQTREQHIKREKATSNICTAQALLANMAAFYAVYHGPKGLTDIATRIATLAHSLAEALKHIGFEIESTHFFDTIKVRANSGTIRPIAEKHAINFRYYDEGHIGISLDETTTQSDTLDIVYVFAVSKELSLAEISFEDYSNISNIPSHAIRSSRFLSHPVFNKHHSETQLMRYMKLLENKDYSLTNGMISLGSCTMKLNAAVEMMPLSWPLFSSLHPYIPQEQAIGYAEIIENLATYLCIITGFDKCSLQPNSGAQGEYAGLLTIMGYHKSMGQTQRNVVLIPVSAHGTNPASAIMAGMKVVVVKGTTSGYIDVDDLKEKASLYSDNLAGLMVTYPSTHGVFEETIKEICDFVHEQGGLVYMDGANMNAQVGLTSPAAIGADVCHLNLHKTFAIPHGGGGPGMGPICVTEALAPFLPGHKMLDNAPTQKTERYHAVSGAPYGSASILLISYAYIKLLGAKGLRHATEFAILNANYMKARLEGHFSILYEGVNGRSAHEFIIDIRPFKQEAGIEAEDVAKRLMDYGFHAPTLSFPVPGTMMIEPTESEDLEELDRFCDAMVSIRGEIQSILSGEYNTVSNPLKNAPHTQKLVCADEWNYPYIRTKAAFPLPYLSKNKFWPSVARINNTLGDRNLICTCQPTEDYMNEK